MRLALIKSPQTSFGPWQFCRLTKEPELAEERLPVIELIAAVSGIRVYYRSRSALYFDPDARQPVGMQAKTDYRFHKGRCDNESYTCLFFASI